MILEICCDSIAGVQAAAEGGAARVELCSALGEGGVTPSLGLMRQARLIPGLRMHVLIRPRGGDFVYDESECECMVSDVKAAVGCGADGVVIGALSPDGRVDTVTCRRLVEAADGCCDITFHRAFDLSRDPFEALEDIIRLGCTRVLTSGMARSAEVGIPILRQLHDHAAGRIIILPGGGVTPANAAVIMRQTGCRELHGSLREAVASTMSYRRDGVTMGAPDSDEYSRLVTSPRLVKETIQAMRSI